MEENKISQFSSETEEIYNEKTENAIKIPEGFKEKIMENVKNEKVKKNGAIKWVAIAACLVIVVGVILLVPALKNNPEEFGTPAEDTAADGALKDSVGDEADSTEASDIGADNAETTADHLEAEKCDPILVGYEKIEIDVSEDLGVKKGARAVMILNKLKFVLHEGHEMNWYEFYNGCIDGTVGNDKAAMLAYAETALEQFEALELTDEAAQAKAIISALQGSAN